MAFKYTLGLDVGTNSIGWAILAIDQNGEPFRIERLGSRIFTDGRNPKDKTTLAAQRRQKRQERRRRDRLKQRKKLVLNQLVEMGLFPKLKEERLALKTLNVLSLRARAASEEVTGSELGRVFFHLNLKRGFLSNRKGGSEDDQKNKITERIEKLKLDLEKNNFKTVGQYLYHRCRQGLSTKATIENDFHLVRGLIESEFDIIVEAQKKYHKLITEAQWAELRNKIFHQRPLKLVETGPCSIYPDKTRTYRYMPSFEEYRFLTELFNLSYQDNDFRIQFLSEEQIFSAFHEFKSKKEVSYTKLKKFLKKSNIDFSIEKTKEKIKISTSNAFFRGDSLFKDHWDSMPLISRDQIAALFFSDAPPVDIRTGLGALSVDADIIESLMEAPLPRGVSEVTCSYSAEVLRKIVELVLEEKRHPALIVQELQKNETKNHTFTATLGYYGSAVPESTQPIPKHIQDNFVHLDPNEKRFGKISNPTVHAALRQIEKVVNSLIGSYGKPENIHIEFARSLKQSKEERDRALKKNKENKIRNDRVRDFIEKHKQKVSSFNIERAKLWFELEAMNNQICIYSGKTISARMVLSEEVQVDHILPFSRTLDDALSNKVLVLASENIKKKNKTPHEAFGGDSKKWAHIQERVKQIPYNKQWRFSQDAIRQFEDQNAFLSRHINDTRYISKIAKRYLGTLIDPNKIVTSRGRLTSILRGKLGLQQFIQNPDGTKNREDHRHHAIDALAVALTSRSYLKAVSSATSKNNDPNRIQVPQPWSGFIENVREKFDNIIVSHKLEHGASGQFMEETCFGLIKNLNEYERENNFKLVTTKPIDAVKDFKTVRDDRIRSIFEKGRVGELPKEIKKLRVYEVSKEDTKDIGSLESGIAKISHGKDGKRHVKLYQKGEINHLAIWHLPKETTLRQEGHKKRKSDYIFVAIKTFDLNSRDHNELRPHPAAKLIAKIYKGDCVALERDGSTQYFILKSIRAANRQLYFLGINKNSESEGEKQFLLAYSRLIDHNFRKVHISPAGTAVDEGALLK